MQIVKSRTVTWIDVQNPTYKDIHRLMRDFNIPPTAANRLKDPTLQPMVEREEGLLFIVLHFPIFDEARQTSVSTEIDFIITPSLLLTARYTDIEPFDKLLRKCSSIPTRGSQYCLVKGSMFLFYYIVKELFDFSLREIDHIHQKIEEVGKEIFAGREKEMVRRISNIKHDIINFSSTITPQRLVLEKLLKMDDFIDTFTRDYISDLTEEYHKIAYLIQIKKETIETLHSTNESLLNAKTNEVIKILTIMAFITFPLMLISSIFGMNTDILPIVGAPNDFWIIIGIMGASMLGFFIFFKSRKWL